MSARRKKLDESPNWQRCYAVKCVHAKGDRSSMFIQHVLAQGDRLVACRGAKLVLIQVSEVAYRAVRPLTKYLDTKSLKA